jgi:hypothetical protein
VKAVQDIEWWAQGLNAGRIIDRYSPSFTENFVFNIAMLHSLYPFLEKIAVRLRMVACGGNIFRSDV